MMISKSNLLINITYLSIITCVIGTCIQARPAHARQVAPTSALAAHYRDFPDLWSDLRQNSTSDKSKSPEHYIDPTLNYGLTLVLPDTLRKGLKFDAGYDRWEGLPTVQADYFLPVKGWSDKSLFFSPRVALSGTKETYALGAGFRHLISSETLIGFHAFHDWARHRRHKGDFMKEVGVGLEFSALPGNYSDLSFTVNAYLPANERITIGQDGNLVIREKFTSGMDARLKFLFPPLTDYLDIRIDTRVHRYQGRQTDVSGYSAAVSVNTRDGWLSATVEQGRDAYTGDYYRVDGNLSLAFDWMELLKGKNPFAAPYQASSFRFSRKMRNGLYDRVARKHDVPMDRTEARVTLAANVEEDTVSFFGGFPDMPNSRVTVQTSQSPWQDAMQVVTDSSGFYSGKLKLPPGEYRLRLIHKPTGRISAVRTIVVGDTGAVE
jgi:hypothetical protein